MNRWILPTIATSTILAGLFFFFQSGNEFQVSYGAPQEGQLAQEIASSQNIIKAPVEVPNQKPLSNPPKVIKAIYATSWSASSAAKMNYLIDLIKKTELNAIVVDIKDYSGTVTYDTKVPEVIKYRARELRIPKINELLKRLHDEGIYVIARLTVFQDPILAKARPSLAIKNSSTGAVWKDNKGIAWIDAGSMEAWDYNIAIAKEAAERGFDEINFDYIRFPSDGSLSLMQYPFSDLKTTTKAKVVKSFFEYLRANTEGIKISADLFGLATLDPGDLGIGQLIEYAYANFDYIAPMIYPSHYASGFSNFKNPADHPYEVIQKSMRAAFARLITFNDKQLAAENTTAQIVEAAELQEKSSKPRAKLRPWLQDFNLGATYDAAKVRAQIKAVTDSLCLIKRTATTNTEGKTITTEICEALTPEQSDNIYGGWMLWDPRNNYTKAALNAE